MRNLSFSLTTPQMRARTKTVTRRKGDYSASVLKPGDLVCAVEKSQGIKKGGLVRLGTVRVVSVRMEPLQRLCGVEYDGDGLPAMSDDECRRECAREGFPEMAGHQFVAMFCEHMGVTPWAWVTRIAFEHVVCDCIHSAPEHGPDGCGFCPCEWRRW